MAWTRARGRDDPPPARARGTRTRLHAADRRAAASGPGRLGGGRSDRGRASGPGRSPACASGSPPRGRWRARGRSPLVGVSTLRSLRWRRARPASGRERARGPRRAPRRGVRRRHGGMRAIRGRARSLAPRVRARRARPAVRSAAVRLLAVGDGAVEFRAVLERCGSGGSGATTRPLHRVTAINHCRLGRGLARRRPDEVHPEYLRLPDAEIARRAARQPMTADAIPIRPLGYSDLPQVIAIERRSFPTPWSLAMFVLELSKPSGVCLAAVERRGARRLLDLLALRPRSGT